MNHAANSIQPAAPSMPIPGALESMGYEINALADTVMEIGKRLDRVLMPPQETLGKAGNGSQLAPVPRSTSAITGDIDNCRSRIEAARHQLQDLLNRLEV